MLKCFFTDNLYVGVNAIATGWGTLKEDGKPSCILQQVEVPVMSNTDCKKNTKYNDKMISDNMMCAGYPDGMKDSCQVSTISILYSSHKSGLLPSFSLISILIGSRI